MTCLHFVCYFSWRKNSKNFVIGQVHCDKEAQYPSDSSCINLCVFGLVVFFPILSVTFRRLHDIGRSGWWWGGYYLVSLLVGAFVVLFSVVSIAATINNPDSMGSMLEGGMVLLIYGWASIVYSIVLLVWSFTEGTRGHNKYGDDPKHENIESNL